MIAFASAVGNDTPFMVVITQIRAVKSYLTNLTF